MSLPPFPRLKFIDFDARRNPKTDRWCIMCQRDLKPGLRTRRVRAVLIGGAPYTIHPDDESAFDAAGATLDVKEFERDLGACCIGTDCARIHGMEWTKPND